MKKKYNIVSGIMLSLTLSLTFASCSDTWDDHYDEQPISADKTILQLIQEDNSLSDFYSLLKATHLYNNNHRTNVTYADLLDSDQSLTVWAPKNGTFNVDSLLDSCYTAKGDSLTGQHFVGNHIAHTLFQHEKLGGLEYIKMHNDKYLYITDIPASLSNDIPANNGLLNIISDGIPYNYNVYEGLTSMGEAQHVGTFIKSYERQELDENASIQRGLEDGKKVYSDSVMIKENILFRTFGQINSEDSSYFALLPSEDVWKYVVTEADPYFNFGNIEKADSIGTYWRNLLLMSDLFFNDNEQASKRGEGEYDSIISTTYDRKHPEDHVFYKPNSAGGILSDTYISGERMCSNGKIYFLKAWPFTKEQLYFKDIKVEGENSNAIIGSADCTFNYRTAIGDSISENEYLDIVPKTSTSNWTVTYELANTLSGTYDIQVVLLPKTVSNPFSRDFKPNKFTAILNYVDVDGSSKQEELQKAAVNDAYVTDTVSLGRFTFPVCNYGQRDALVTLQLKCNVANREVKYSREMLLDCIILKPVEKEDEQ